VKNNSNRLSTALLEHTIIHDVLENLNGELVDLVANPYDLSGLRRAMDILTDTLLSHLAYEEHELVEPLARYGFTTVKFARSERFEVEAHGRARIRELPSEDVEPSWNVPLGVDDLFGEMSLLDGTRRSAPVTAEANMTVTVFERNEFFRLVETSPAIAMKLLAAMAARLRSVDQDLKAGAPETCDCEQSVERMSSSTNMAIESPRLIESD